MNISINDTKAVKLRIEKINRYSENFIKFVKKLPTYIPDKGIIAGPRRFYRNEPYELWNKIEEDEIFWGIDNCHFPINSSFLSIGYIGIIKKASLDNPELSREQLEFLGAIKRVYEAATEYIHRHELEAEMRAKASSGLEKQNFLSIADNCRHLCENAPGNFAQAVQLFWFTWRLRGIFTSSIGRLDQYLYPFYKKDVENGILTREKALEILCELWEVFNEAGTGDTLKNLMLGGVNEEGKDAVNELSYLMLEASIKIRMPEPHLNVRLHSNSPQDFIKKTVELQLIGQGQPTIYNDDILIPALINFGIPKKSARNYSNDGCTELVIDGESGIFFEQMEAVKSFELTLFNGKENDNIPIEPFIKKWTHRMTESKVKTRLKLGYKSGDLTKMNSFDEIYDAFLKQYFYQTDIMLDNICSEIKKLKENEVSSLFLSGAFPLCLEKAEDPLRGGFNIECYQLLSGSITTVADCLAGIKKIVFEERYCSMKELLEALSNNFEGQEVLRQRLLNAPKFGNDDDFVDIIAADIARRFCEHVLRYKTHNGKRVWPGLYNIDFATFAKILGATPDGRKAGDPIAEHFSPTPGRAKNGPTAVIQSAVKAPLYLGFASSPIHITLSRDSIPMDQTGRFVLINLLTTSLKLGVDVLNIAIYDSEILKQAKIYPERYGDIVVRVWGFNARFVDLTEELQDHIIARIIS
jgi:formate C-acetyltransferase